MKLLKYKKFRETFSEKKYSLLIKNDSVQVCFEQTSSENSTLKFWAFIYIDSFYKNPKHAEWLIAAVNIYLTLSIMSNESASCASLE